MCPFNMDYSIWGSIFGSLYFGRLKIMSKLQASKWVLSMNLGPEAMSPFTVFFRFHVVLGTGTGSGNLSSHGSRVTEQLWAK